MAEESDAIKRADKRVGTVLKDKYTLDRLLGAGGMAAVYAATHRNQKQFAVKMLHAELSVHEDMRARFLREGYAANSVKHSGAVAVMDDDRAEDGSAFLVMELLEGTTLDDWWDRAGQRLDLESVLGIAWQLLDVLAAAHANSVVHRDVKPSNLFVTRAGELKVLDFGIARVQAVAASGRAATGSGVLLGTPAFMAPEQARGKTEDIDARTDLWAVGATMFTLLTGRDVHEGETAQIVMVQGATQQARSIATLLESLPPEAVHVIDKALAFERAARWPSAELMRDAVQSAHVSLFGKDPSPAALAAKPAALAARSGPRAPISESVASAPTLTEVPNGPAASTWATTGQPVSTNRTKIALSRSTAPYWLAKAAALVLVVGGGSVLAVRALEHRGDDPKPHAAEALAAPAPSPSTSAAAGLAPSLSASASALGVSATGSAAAVVSMPPRSPSRPKPKRDCSPNYHLDAEGNQHFKPECFK